MGRSRIPTATLKLHGTYRSDQREAGEPEPEGVPRKPSGLGRDGAWLWDHVVPHLIATGVATAEDQPALTAMCRWWGEYRRADRGRSVDRFREMKQTWGECIRLMSKFGLTPVDRTYIKAEKSQTVKKGKGRFFAG